jgi:DNA-directed RNA polymerase specialized sigma24 family protein
VTARTGHLHRLGRTAKALDRARRDRDEAIVRAHADGLPAREIARAVGMTHPAVLGVVRRSRDARPVRNDLARRT